MEDKFELGMQQSRFDSIPILELVGIGWNWNWNRMGLVRIGIGIGPELAGIDPRYIQIYDYFLLNEKYF